MRAFASAGLGLGMADTAVTAEETMLVVVLVVAVLVPPSGLFFARVCVCVCVREGLRQRILASRSIRVGAVDDRGCPTPVPVVAETDNLFEEAAEEPYE